MAAIVIEFTEKPKLLTLGEVTSDVVPNSLVLRDEVVNEAVVIAKSPNLTIRFEKAATYTSPRESTATPCGLLKSSLPETPELH